MTSLSFSIVIPNHNYGAYLAQAIDSALALDWPDVEVIVVDDGSTDTSLEIIARYGERINASVQANAGQVHACTAGFARSRGDVIVFLDSDDLVDASLAREVAKVWRPGISKVQVQMKTIDASGQDQGTFHPQYMIVPSPEEIRKWATNTGAYPTPPGSGNAYARSFVASIFPVREVWDSFSDSYLIAAAPFLGDVITIPKPLVSYRVHGRNAGSMMKLESLRFGREVALACKRFSYAQKTAASVGIQVPAKALNVALFLIPYRLASMTLTPESHAIVSDTRLRILADAMRGLWTPQGVTRLGRSAIFIWCLLVSILPKQLARSLILWRFAPVSRPPALSALLRNLRIVR